MAYEFFFSYTRSNNDEYLRRFFTDLEEVVRERRGLPKAAPVGFFDQHDIELGGQWQADIIDALQTSKALVALYSPGYFKSEYCGKEWRVFQSRCEASRQAHGNWPAAIKPVLWVRLAAGDVPADLADAQYTLGDPQAIHNQRGLKYLLKQEREFKGAYNDFVENLADQVIAAGDRHTLPALAPVPELAAVRSAFAPAGSPASTTPHASGPNHVHFVYVAASPSEFGPARAPEPYLQHGGGDWRPFWPACEQRIHRFVQHVVSHESLDFSSDEIAFGANLEQDIANAWERREIVVIIIDGWSVQWKAQYRDVLARLDGRLDCHWCVLVPWNEADQETAQKRQDIQQCLARTFYRHLTLSASPILYRDGIRSLEELRVVLAEVLTRLKQIIRDHAPPGRPVPAGPAMQFVSGHTG